MKPTLAFAAVLCATASLSAQALSLTTTFASNAGSTTTWASPSSAFDINVTNPGGVLIDSLLINTPYVGIPGTFEFYTTEIAGTAFGNQIAPAPGTWILRATGTYTTAGTDTPAAVTLNKPVHLPFGTFGVYLVQRGTGLRYTNGTPLVYTNSDMTLTMGTAQATAFTSTLNTPRIANLTLNYTIPTDAVDFTADVVKGPSPLGISFTDRSVITTGTVNGYEWDFENDGIPDSFVQNATFVYGTCGTFSPKLRIYTTNGVFERVWADMITVDPLTADFTATPTLGSPLLTVQFTDASAGATGWAWDFDGDGVTDSTQQSPSWTFGAGSYGATLTVTNSCRSATVTKRIDAVTNTWATTYNAATNLIAKQALAFFDIVVTSNEALFVTAIDVNTIVHKGQPCPIKVFLTDGTASGKQQTASAWREVASGTGVSAGGNTPTQIVLNRPLLLLPGRTYGVAVNYLDAQAYYNSPGVATLFGPDFTVNFWGVNTATVPFSAAATTRQWNGGLFYTKVGSWPIGSITPFAQGCAGTLGVPTMTPVGATRPKLGALWSVEVGNMPVGAAFMMLGFSNTNSAFGPLPLDLTFFGMPGCSAFVSADITTFLFSGGSTVTFNSTFPNDPVFAGLQIYMQSLVLDPAANGFGGVMSDALALCLGVY